MTKKPGYGLLFVLLASLALSLPYIPGYDQVWGDKEIWRYIGQLMAKGGIPYRDAFDHKPPLIFFFNYFSWLLGGWGLWLIDVALVMLASSMFYKLCQAHRLLHAWVPPLLFNLMLRDQLMNCGIGMTREYTAIFLLIFFCVVMGNSRLKYYWLGLLGGLTLFIQQDQVLALVPFAIYALRPGNGAAALRKRLLWAAAGVVTVALPVIGYFALNHALEEFWYQAFVFNFSWYTTTLKATPWDHWRKAKATLDTGNYEMVFMVIVTLGVVALARRSSNKLLLFFALAAVFLSIAEEFMGGRQITYFTNPRAFTHYYLPLAASLPILLFTVFAFTEEATLRPALVQGILEFLALASLVYTNLQNGVVLQPNGRSEVAVSAEMQFLRQQHPGDFQFFVFGSTTDVYINNELKVLAPSRWIYHHFWNLYDKWDADHRLLRGIEEDLLRHRTNYILDFSSPSGWFRDPSAGDDWRGFLQAHYQQVLVNKDRHSVLWKWREGS